MYIFSYISIACSVVSIKINTFPKLKCNSCSKSLSNGLSPAMLIKCAHVYAHKRDYTFKVTPQSHFLPL